MQEIEPSLSMWCSDKIYPQRNRECFHLSLLLFDVQAITLLHHELKWIHARELVIIANKPVWYSSWDMRVMLMLIYVLGLLFANRAASKKGDVICFNVPGTLI